jgi:hypothetical protein
MLKEHKKVDWKSVWHFFLAIACIAGGCCILVYISKKIDKATAATLRKKALRDKAITRRAWADEELGEKVHHEPLMVETAVDSSGVDLEMGGTSPGPLKSHVRRTTPSTNAL